MRITSAGNVGINSTNPDFPSSGDKVLNVTGTSTRATLLLANSSTGTSGVGGSIKAYNGSTFLTSIDMIADGATNSGAFVLYTANAGSNGERFRIASTGAATFASSVTATSGNFVGLVDILNSTLPLRIVNTIATSNQQSWIKLRQAQNNLFGFDIGIDTTTGGDFFISRANGSDTITEAFRIARATGNVGIGTTSPSVSLHIATTDAIAIPVGTTAQRPSSPPTGSFRYNSNLSLTEYYDGSNWYQHKSDGIAIGSNYAAEYLVVAGGGGGGAGYGNGNAVGGGGGGGMITGSSLPLISGNTYYVVVGAAGAGGAGTTGGSVANQGYSGGYSSIGSIVVAVGGGGGGASGYGAKSGGSGGGGYTESDKGYSTLGQGNDGGVGIATDRPYRGGGGGGRNTAGDTGASSGNGGNGMTSTISGSFVYAGGGGGGCYTPDTPGTGGTGGGGNGGTGTGDGTGGNSNSGGGGGGGGWPASGLGGTGGNGGSGIVIIKYPGSQRGTGGTISTLNGYTIHKFTSSGVFVA
jgi:hypothetical protein